MNTTEAAKDERVVCSHGFASRCPIADDYSCDRDVTA